MRDIVYFDLETQRSFSAVGGSKNKGQMGISVGVAYSTRTGQYHVFGENDTDELVEMLTKADLVVGYNHIYFDYPVLEGYTILDMATQTANLDMMIDLEEKLGFRLKLDSVAGASLGAGKSADGLDALRWWNEYKKTGDNSFIMKIAEYCCFDVKVTKMVHEFGMENGFVRYDDRSGNICECEVSW